MQIRNTFYIVYTLIILTFCSCNKGDYKINIVFDNVEGVEINDLVIDNDSVIGKIENMKIFKTKVLVEVLINENYKISNKSKFMIQQSGIISKCILVKQSTDTNSYIKDNDTLIGEKNEYEKSEIEKLIQVN